MSGLSSSPSSPSAVDTIFALSSGRPPAAVSVIRISGPKAHVAAERMTGSLPPPRRTVLRNLRHPETGELLDRALVMRFDGPNSATGEDIVEFHCHGGRAVVEAVLVALRSMGEEMRQAIPGEFTRRAFENGRIDLTEAEGLADLIEAETESQRKAAIAVANGGLRNQIESWRTSLLNLSAMAEQAIDYDESDHDVAPELSAACAALASALDEWLARPRVEPLKDGVRVVVAGPPNAGKSSIINVLTDSDRAIVTAIPGTTRDYIEVPVSIGGVPVLLIDTAGLRETDDEIESAGIARTGNLLAGADIVVWLGNPQEAPVHPRLILVHAQADRADREPAPAKSLPTSVVTGEGLADLLDRISGHARAVLPSEGALALNRRQATHLSRAADHLRSAQMGRDIVVSAEELRLARLEFDRLTGRAGIEDVLDSLFARFCLGK